MIEAVLFDIDGVLTDGMVYIDSEGKESKKISFDDIDAIFELKKSGVKIGFITGEHSSFSEYVKKRFDPDYFVSGCKDKLSYFKKLKDGERLSESNVCYVGDSKKDIELLEYLKYSFVPVDVSSDIKGSAKFITKSARGNGVIKEVAMFVLCNRQLKNNAFNFKGIWENRLSEHAEVINCLQKDTDLFLTIEKSAKVLVNALMAGKKILLCGNGGSAADSQHLATELISRFWEAEQTSYPPG